MSKTFAAPSPQQSEQDKALIGARPDDILRLSLDKLFEHYRFPAHGMKVLSTDGNHIVVQLELAFFERLNLHWYSVHLEPHVLSISRLRAECPAHA